MPHHVDPTEHDTGRGSAQSWPTWPLPPPRHHRPPTAWRHPRVGEAGPRARDGHPHRDPGPDLAVEAARLQLDAISDPAREVHGTSTPPKSQTTHIAVADRAATSRPSSHSPSPRLPITPRTGNRRQWVAIVPDLAPRGDVLLPQHPLHQQPTHGSALPRHRRVPARSSVRACGQRQAGVGHTTNDQGSQEAECADPGHRSAGTESGGSDPSRHYDSSEAAPEWLIARM